MHPCKPSYWLFISIVSLDVVRLATQHLHSSSHLGTDLTYGVCFNGCSVNMSWWYIHLFRATGWQLVVASASYCNWKTIYLRGTGIIHIYRYLWCIILYQIVPDHMYTVYHIISYYITLNYSILLHYTILYYTILYYIILYYIILYYIILYYNILCYIMLYYIILYYIILYYIIFSYIILYYNIILYYIILYYIMYHYLILYIYILYYIIFNYIHWCPQHQPFERETHHWDLQLFDHVGILGNLRHKLGLLLKQKAPTIPNKSGKMKMVFSII